MVSCFGSGLDSFAPRCGWALFGTYPWGLVSRCTTQARLAAQTRDSASASLRLESDGQVTIAGSPNDSARAESLRITAGCRAAWVTVPQGCWQGPPAHYDRAVQASDSQAGSPSAGPVPRRLGRGTGKSRPKCQWPDPRLRIGRASQRLPCCRCHLQMAQVILGNIAHNIAQYAIEYWIFFTEYYL